MRLGACLPILYSRSLALLLAFCSTVILSISNALQTHVSEVVFIDSACGLEFENYPREFSAFVVILWVWLILNAQR